MKIENYNSPKWEQRVHFENVDCEFFKTQVWFRITLVLRSGCILILFWIVRDLIHSTNSPFAYPMESRKRFLIKSLFFSSFGVIFPRELFSPSPELLVFFDGNINIHVLVVFIKCRNTLWNVTHIPLSIHTYKFCRAFWCSLPVCLFVNVCESLSMNVKVLIAVHVKVEKLNFTHRLYDSLHKRM